MRRTPALLETARAEPRILTMAPWTRSRCAVALPVLLCLGCPMSSSTDGGTARLRRSVVETQSLEPHDAETNTSAVPAPVYARPSSAELRQKLTRIQFEVTQNEATEPPFRNEYWDNHAPGIYVDVATGEPLFSSIDKFESGTGWPSFTRAIEDGHVVPKSDGSLGMSRTEVRSSGGDSHLGHVFDDGPPPTGLRYCINSASLRFVPVDRLTTEGYGRYASRFRGAAGPPNPASTANTCANPKPGERPGCEATLDIEILRGGAKAAESLRDVAGVIEVDSETTNGVAAARVTFDPKRIAYADLLAKWVSLGGTGGDRKGAMGPKGP